MRQPQIGPLRVLVVAGIGVFAVLANLFFQNDQLGLAVLMGLIGVGLGILEVLDIPKPKSLFADEQTLTEDAIYAIISRQSLLTITNHLGTLETRTLVAVRDATASLSSRGGMR